MKTLIATLIILLYSPSIFAKQNCTKAYLSTHPQTILSCYIALPEQTTPPWLIDTDDYDNRGVNIESYQLHSQQWPKPDMSQHPTEWTHRLIIYRPNTVTTHQALLFVNGGTTGDYNKSNPQSLKLDFAKIALATQSIVVDLQDVPEQSLTLDDNVPRKEDSLVAYSWNRYLKSPKENPYWPIQLPMTKSVIKAMDAVQQIIAQEENFQITHFVVSGVSKRGEAIWLAALIDNRINAIVPIVINTVNIKPLLNLTYNNYDKHWPPAFRDYIAQHITDQIETPEFAQLLQVIDPINYLNCQNCDNFKNRLSIPKYIINASGDDFFVPDSLNVYLEKLPGENLVRITPNERHAINPIVIENALLAYYESVIYQIPRPHLQWTTNKTTGALQTLSVNSPPVSVQLWEAVNPDARDFRLSQHINYTSKKITSTCQKSHCEYSLNITPPEKGWKTDFIEVTYEFTNGDFLVLTTPAYVIASQPKSPVTVVERKLSLLEKIKEKFISPKHKGERAMQETENLKYKKELVDVVALSKKKCATPIRAKLAYGTRDNFVGQVIDGYTPKVNNLALMTKPAAEALCQVQNYLDTKYHLGLLIYDSYRPKQAVKHFVRWSLQPVADKHELAQKSKHYPHIEKSRMFELGYVAEDSQHCYGHTVDLVLVDKTGHELNHGVPFDFMDKLSHLDVTADQIGTEAFNNRKILRDAMEKFGFIAFPNEFWHFSYKDKTILEAMNIPVTPDLEGLNVES